MTAVESILCSNRRPLLLWASAFIFLTLALTLSPKTLLALGIMAESITSEIDGVRKTTLMEIWAIRGGLFCMGLFLSGLLLCWKQFAGSAFSRAIRAHPTRFYIKEQANSVLNGSFACMVLATVANLVYFAFAKQCLDVTTLSLVGGEDGIVETISAFLFLGCAVASAGAVSAVKDVPARRRILIIFAAGFLFCFGEEISWGQRMIGFSTPEFMGEANVQNEANLHNLFGYFTDHLFSLIMLTYGIIFPLLQRFIPFWRSVFSMLGLPVPSLGLAAGIALAALLQKRMIWKLVPASSGILVTEFRETIMALGLLLLLLEYHNLLVRIRNAEP